jgi:hypothetical protein
MAPDSGVADTPSRSYRSRILWVFVAATVVVAAGLLYTKIPPSPDQQIFDHIGWMGSNGATYYVDVVEQNWPGKMMIHEWAIELFGVHSWTFRAFDYLWMLIGLAMMSELLRAEGRRVAAATLVLIYPIMYVCAGAWFSGQRDVVAAHVLFVSAAVFAHRLRGGGAWLALVAGLAIAGAALIRPTYLSFLPGLFLIDLVLHWKDSRSFRMILIDGGLVAASTFGGLAAVLIWGWEAGTLPAWYQQTIQFNLQAYQDPGTLVESIQRQFGWVIRSWSWYFAFSLAGISTLIRLPGRTVAFGLTLGIMGVGLLSAIVQKKGLGYHLGAWLPALGIGVAVWLDYTIRLFKTRPRSVLGLVLAPLCIAITFAGLGSKVRATLLTIEGDSIEEDIAAYVREHTRTDDYILVWSRRVGIYPLAGRQPTTRFVTVGMLKLATPPFRGASEWQAEFLAELNEKPPALIVISSSMGLLVGETQSEVALRNLIETQFHFVRTFEGDAVYLPKGTKDGAGQQR